MRPTSPEEKAERRKELEASLIKVNMQYAQVFGAGAGEDILADLEANFGGTCLVANDPYMTHARAGAQEVLTYIRQRMRTPTDA